jgi:glycosyltransferase involved in cell wall biosynthesis
VEQATGAVEVTHATGLIPCPTSAPLVVTVHDLAFLRSPASFTRWGRLLFRRSLQVIRRRADLVLCSSLATMDDCEGAGINVERLRHVPLGVRVNDASPDEVDAVRHAYELPDEFLLFVGTVEPRKNLDRLIAAVARLDEPLPLVIAGAEGWGDRTSPPPPGLDVRFLGFVPEVHKAALYAAASVFCYPSIWEGFGLPIAEAMAQGTPVVTSRGTSTEEVGGEATVLVDPTSIDDIAGGIAQALARRDELSAAGRARAGELTWAATADRTLAAYQELV